MLGLKAWVVLFYGDFSHGGFDTWFSSAINSPSVCCRRQLVISEPLCNGSQSHAQQWNFGDIQTLIGNHFSLHFIFGLRGDVWSLSIGVGAQSTLEARHFRPKIYAWKINKMPEFYMSFARKIFFPIFFLGGGASAPSCPPPTPTPMNLIRLHPRRV